MKKCLFLFILFISNSTIAQGTYNIGLLPSININTDLSQKWNLNFKTESRQLLKSGTFNEDRNSGYEYILTDYTTIVSRTVGLNNAITAGYLFRVEGDEIIHRSIQQFIITRRFPKYRLAHRFSTDQTFTQSESPVFRLRYRITVELPLNGDAVDQKEFYLKINNEYLNEWQSSGYDLEARLVPLLGYVFTDNNKLEAGVDYRINSFIKGASDNTFWFSANWFIKI